MSMASTTSTSDPAWVSSWAEVSSLVTAAPLHQLDVDWPHLEIREPNTTVSVGAMKVRPSLSWPAETGALYTAMIVDGGIQSILPKV